MKYYGIYFCALLWEWERTAFCFNHNWKPEVWQPTVLMHVKFLGIFGISEKCAVTPGADQDFVPSGNREGIILLEWSLQDFFSDNSGWGSQWCFRVLFSGLFFFFPRGFGFRFWLICLCTSSWTGTATGELESSFCCTWNSTSVSDS